MRGKFFTVSILVIALFSTQAIMAGSPEEPLPEPEIIKTPIDDGGSAPTTNFGGPGGGDTGGGAGGTGGKRNAETDTRPADNTNDNDNTSILDRLLGSWSKLISLFRS